MTSTLQEALVALIITGIIGGIIKVYLDYTSSLMEKIWEKRLEAYMHFVKKTALFPEYPRKDVTWKELYQLSMDFRDWYFEGYGLVLSNTVRDDYFDLQRYILKISTDKKDSEVKLTTEEYTDMRERCSHLRTVMAKELESRQSPIWHRFKRTSKV